MLNKKIFDNNEKKSKGKCGVCSSYSNGYCMENGKKKKKCDYCSDFDYFKIINDNQ